LTICGAVALARAHHYEPLAASDRERRGNTRCTGRLFGAVRSVQDGAIRDHPAVEGRVPYSGERRTSASHIRSWGLQSHEGSYPFGRTTRELPAAAGPFVFRLRPTHIRSARGEPVAVSRQSLRLGLSCYIQENRDIGEAFWRDLVRGRKQNRVSCEGCHVCNSIYEAGRSSSIERAAQTLSLKQVLAGLHGGRAGDRSPHCGGDR